MELKLIIETDSDSDLVAEMPVNKYNKLGWFSSGWDDGEIQGLENAIKIWEEIGLSNDDGCGNLIPCSGSVALCKDKQGVPIESDTDLIERINANRYIRGDISNHSLDHDDEDKKRQVDLMNDLIFDVFSYKPNIFVIPVNFKGFAQPCLDAGMLGITAQGDHYEPYNSGRYYLTMPNNPALPSDIPMFRMARAFFDSYEEQSTIDYMKGQIDGYNTIPGKFCIMDTHDPLTASNRYNGFKEIYQYLKDTMSNEVSVFSLREALEYRYMRSVPMTQEQDGNTLTITFNSLDIHDRIRWRDVSLIVNGGNILSVSHEGFETSSFNENTGLVNGFFDKKQWSNSPIEIMVKHGKFVI